MPGGRPSGSGPYGEPTTVIRVPRSRAADIKASLKRPESNAQIVGSASIDRAESLLPLVEAPRPQAGFPSPAADFVEDAIDLQGYLVRNPPATFCARMSGVSMEAAGLMDGDIVVVDRSVEAVPGKIVLAAVDGDFYIKRYRIQDGRPALCSEPSRDEKAYQPIYLDAVEDSTLWGVVTGAVRRL